MAYSKVVTCGHCNNISKMEIKGGVYEDKTERDYDPEDGLNTEWGIHYDILTCPACAKENIVKYVWHDGMEGEEEITYKLLYPINDNTPLGLPEKILNAFNAAEKVRTIDVNAYAILMRRLLELVCIDRNAKKGTLAEMLKDLSSKNEIPEKLVEVAKGLKDLGNLGAHAGIGEMSEKEIPILKALSRAILEYIYSAPLLASIAEKKLKDLKAK
jgi:uncharacterized protein YbaR (Trm112 family)